MSNTPASSDKYVDPESITLETVQEMMRDEVTFITEALVGALCNTIEHAHLAKDAVLTTIDLLSSSTNVTAADSDPKSHIIAKAWAKYRNAWEDVDRIRDATTSTMMDVCALIKEEQKMLIYLRTLGIDDSSPSKIAGKTRAKESTAEPRLHELPLRPERCSKTVVGKESRQIQSDLRNSKAVQVRDDKPPSLDHTDTSSNQHGPLLGLGLEPEPEPKRKPEPEPEIEKPSQPTVPSLMHSKKRTAFRAPRSAHLAENIDAAVARARQARYERWLDMYSSKY